MVYLIAKSDDNLYLNSNELSHSMLLELSKRIIRSRADGRGAEDTSLASGQGQKSQSDATRGHGLGAAAAGAVGGGLLEQVL